MRFRNFRFAWSVAWGVVALLLVALWIRSYWWTDHCEWHATNTPVVVVESVVGRTLIAVCPADEWDYIGWWWKPEAVESVAEARLLLYYDPHTDHPVVAGFQISLDDRVDSVVLPDCFVVATISAIGALPWLPLKRFSLKSLLIATTLVAVALGLIVWLSR